MNILDTLNTKFLVNLIESCNNLEHFRPQGLNGMNFITNFDKNKLWIYKEISIRLGDNSCGIYEEAYDCNGKLIKNLLAFYSIFDLDVVMYTLNQIEKERFLDNPLLLFDNDIPPYYFTSLMEFSSKEVEYILETLSKSKCEYYTTILQSIRRAMFISKLVLKRDSLYTFYNKSKYEWRLLIKK